MLTIPPMYTSDDVRRVADSTGSFYFSDDTMRFFNSRLLDGFWPTGADRTSGYIVVSNRDKFRDVSMREYNVVHVKPVGKSSGHVELDFSPAGVFYSADKAKREASRLAKVIFDDSLGEGEECGSCHGKL